ncbi:hypothetical protein Syun_016762 [Stephania yunnanensis]|uniref:Reverse transcriptase domain-containing protein n=1 Tax=Stephania yunnanensis TaxID=152371 RepID=A0AAP0J7A0_9MAGN
MEHRNTYGKSIELVDTMIRRRVNIACLQETKWVGEKSREIGSTGFKLWYTGIDRKCNGVGIVVDNDYKDKVVEVKRMGDRLILVKLIIGDEKINILSAYAPQVGLSENIKHKFWDDMDGFMQSIPLDEKVFIGGDLNGHVGVSNDGFERVHGGFGYGNRNEEGESILEFSSAYDLVLANTSFRKRESHIITFSSGHNKSQIDFLLTRKIDRKLCRDCKVIPGEALTTQHKLVVLDIKLTQRKNMNKRVSEPTIKWWNLKHSKQVEFREKLLKENVWNLDLDANTLWLEISSCIRRVGSNILGISKGLGPPKKETWWWNEDVQRAIKTKRDMYRKIPKCQDEDAYNQYREARKQAKKVVSQAKTNFMEDLYTKLGNRDGEKYIYRLAKLRDKKKQDLSHVRCIKDENQNVLTREEDIKERWRSYFDSLFNDGQVDTIIDENPHQERNVDYTCNIRIVEVKEALKRMKIGKACGPDEIPIKVWKCLGEIGLTWLTKLFNKILKSKRMPMDWRRSTLVPIFKNKGDIQSCSNYWGIKLMSHTMKLWERIIDNRLRRETTISENQFGFMPGRSTMEAIFLVRRLLEKYREKKKRSSYGIRRFRKSI